MKERETFIYEWLLYMLKDHINDDQEENVKRFAISMTFKEILGM